MDLLAQMATFVRIVDLGNLSAAARAARLSLPAVSRQLRALEDDLGASLVVRTTRRLKVTEEGRQWYAHCARILGDVAAARAAIGGGDVHGTLTVSVPVSLGLSQVVPRLAALQRGRPGLAIDLRLEDHFVDFVADGVDVIVRGGAPPPDSATVIAHPLLRFPRVAVASPAYLRRRGAPRDPAALAGHDCLVQLGANAPLRTWHLRRGDDERAVDVAGRLRATAPLALREAARAGLGIALLGDWLVADDLARGTLRRVLPAWASPPITAWAIYRVEARSSPRVRAFLDGMLAA